VIFIILFVREELSFDKWLPDSGNLYRVEVDAQPPAAGGSFRHGAVPDAGLHEGAFAGSDGDDPAFVLQHDVQQGGRQFPEDINETDPDFFTVMKLRWWRVTPARCCSIRNPLCCPKRWPANTSAPSTQSASRW